MCDVFFYKLRDLTKINENLLDYSAGPFYIKLNTFDKNILITFNKNWIFLKEDFILILEDCWSLEKDDYIHNKSTSILIKLSPDILYYYVKYKICIENTDLIFENDVEIF